MTKSDISVLPQFFDRYIHLVQDIDIVDALTQQASFDALIPLETLQALGDLRYAPGKWTGRDILQHVIDTERIMTYRAMRFARTDQTALASFDEELFADSARANQRTLTDLYDEFASVRQSSIWLFKSFDDDMLVRSGTASNQTISVLALGFVAVGHALHHATILQERYLPLLS